MKARSTSSYTIGELIFSICFVSVSALVLALSLNELRLSEAASATTLALVSLEQTLSEDLVNPAHYQTEDVKAALRAGLSPKARFQLSKDASIQPNETVYLDRSLKPCTGYPIGDCGFKVSLNLSPQPPAFSYEVSSSFRETALSLTRKGRNEIAIPRALYRDPGRVVCDPRREIGLTGLVSSDRYECLSRPRKSCPRGTLPKRFHVVDGALELDCAAPATVARCPAFYSLAMVDTRTLDAVGTAQVQCVRTTASVASPPEQPKPGLRMVGRACPTGYRSQSTCTLVNVTAKPGRCGMGVARPVPGRLKFVENQPSAGSVDCGVELQGQTCGAIWMGYAQLKINCVLDLPETARAI